jgi:hypothetical protein
MHPLFLWPDMPGHLTIPVNPSTQTHPSLNGPAASEVLQRLKQVSTARRSTSDSVYQSADCFKYKERSCSTHMDATGSSWFVTWEVQQLLRLFINHFYTILHSKIITEIVLIEVLEQILCATQSPLHLHQTLTIDVILSLCLYLWSISSEVLIWKQHCVSNLHSALINEVTHFTYILL